MFKVTFDNLDAELYHLALLLAGDRKANIIKILRTYDNHFNGKLQDVINYLVNYIDFCIARSPSVGYQKHCTLCDQIAMPMTLPNVVWFKVLEYHCNNDAHRTVSIIKPSIVPLSENGGEGELERITHEHYLPFNSI